MKRTDRLHVRVERDIMNWLERSARCKRTTVSEVTRQLLLKLYEERHK